VAGSYVERHGYESWEVDALPPEVLHQVLEESILEYMELDRYNKILKQEEKDIAELQDVIDGYEAP